MTEPTHEPVVLQEEDVLPRRLILLVMALVIFFTAVVITATVFTVGWLVRGTPTASAPGPRPRGADDGLFDGGPLRGRRLISHQRRLLEHYSWVDRKTGVVRIPVARAMELELTEEGQP